MQNLFSTREIATAIWLFVFLVCVMLNKTIRKSVIALLKVLFGKPLRRLLVLILAYNTVLTVVIALNLPFWKPIYLKEVILWVVTSGMYTAFNACDKNSDEKYILQCLKKNTGIAIVFAFVINTFPFPLVIELLLIPLAVILIVVNVASEKKAEHKSVYIFTNGVLATLGICMILGTFHVGLRHYTTLQAVDVFFEFFLPLLYLIGDIPLVFVIQIIALYQTVFSRMAIKDKDDRRIIRMHRRKVIKACGISIKKLRAVQTECIPRMYKLMDEEAFDGVLMEFEKKKV